MDAGSNAAIFMRLPIGNDSRDIALLAVVPPNAADTLTHADQRRQRPDRRDTFQMLRREVDCARLESYARTIASARGDPGQLAS